MGAWEWGFLREEDYNYFFLSQKSKNHRITSPAAKLKPLLNASNQVIFY